MPSNCFLLETWKLTLSPPNERISKLFVIATTLALFVSIRSPAVARGSSPPMPERAAIRQLHRSRTAKSSTWRRKIFYLSTTKA